MKDSSGSIRTLTRRQRRHTFRGGGASSLAEESDDLSAMDRVPCVVPDVLGLMVVLVTVELGSRRTVPDLPGSDIRLRVISRGVKGDHIFDFACTVLFSGKEQRRRIGFVKQLRKFFRHLFQNGPHTDSFFVEMANESFKNPVRKTQNDCRISQLAHYV